MTAPRLQLDVPASSTPDQLYDLHDDLQRHLAAALEGPAGEAARAHLYEKRRLSPEMVRRLGLGYVPPGETSVRDIAVRERWSLERCVDAALLKRDVWKVAKAFRDWNDREPTSSEELREFFLGTCRENRAYYRDYHSIVVEDEGGRKRYLMGDWIAIPIRIATSSGARIGGFQLRSNRPGAEIGKEGRYRNPVNTVAMTWNEVLIGLATERERMERTGEGVLVEGFFDAAATMSALEELHGDARPGVFALGGINVRRGDDREGSTPAARAGVLAPLGGARRLVSFLDSDEKGTDAILTVGPRLSAMGPLVSVARIEDGWDGPAAEIPKDSGELWERRGAEAFRRIFEAARGRGLVSFASTAVESQLAEGSHGAQARRRLEALDLLLPLAVAAPAGVRDRALERVAAVTALPVATVTALATPTPAQGAATPDGERGAARR